MKTFAAIYIGSYEISMKVFELSIKRGIREIDHVRHRIESVSYTHLKVMEQKDKEGGILGVVADLIQVDKKYETAIEVALSGNIQNIVTKDEQTAKKMIAYMKPNRLGRATFLPS